MKGNPCLRLAVAVVGLAMVGSLLFRLTHGNAPTESHHGETYERPTNASTATLVRIRASSTPRTLTLRHESEVIAEWEQPVGYSWEIERDLAVASEGVELILEATFSVGGEHAALTVELEPEGLEALHETAWAEAGEIEAFLTFQWP